MYVEEFCVDHLEYLEIVFFYPTVLEDYLFDK